jgi:hypothetical protein
MSDEGRTGIKIHGFWTWEGLIPELSSPEESSRQKVEDVVKISMSWNAG